MTIVRARNLHLSYGREPVLRDIHLEINEPKIYGLLGRNGAGKTSLLSLIGSFREPTSGELLVCGEAPFENARLMQDVAFVYDKEFAGESAPPAKVLKQIRTFRPRFDFEYAMELLDKFQLNEKKQVQKLSKGKKSAFNIVIGLASRSPITIFDEAHLGMDAPARDLFYKELLKEQERHPRVVILSTHLVSEMEYLFDEVIILKDGKILLHEPREDIVARGATVIGNKEAIESFAKGKTILNEERLGDLRSITIFNELSEADRAMARKLGLEMSPVSLNDLFIHLTREGN